MSTANLDGIGFGAIELGVEVDAVIKTGNKANPVLVARRVAGVSGYKCGREVEEAAGLLARRPPRWSGWPQGCLAATGGSGSLWARPESLTQASGGRISAQTWCRWRPPRWSCCCQGCCKAATGQWVALGKAGGLNTGDWWENLCPDLVQGSVVSTMV